MEDIENIENIENVEISVKAEEITDETDPMEILDRFLDARMAKKKMEILSENADRIDEKMIGNIEASLDLPGGNGSLSDRIDYVLYCLRTKSRFETDRLR